MSKGSYQLTEQVTTGNKQNIGKIGLDYNYEILSELE